MDLWCVLRAACCELFVGWIQLVQQLGERLGQIVDQNPAIRQN